MKQNNLKMLESYCRQ